MKPYVFALLLYASLLTSEAASPVQPRVQQVAGNTRTITVTVTGYCNDNCKICCGIYASKSPRTASGTIPVAKRTVACNFLKFGTRVVIGSKTYAVEDRLAKKYSDRIDIFFDTHKEAQAFGKQKLSVTILIKP